MSSADAVPAPVTASAAVPPTKTAFLNSDNIISSSFPYGVPVHLGTGTFGESMPSRHAKAPCAAIPVRGAATYPANQPNSWD